MKHICIWKREREFRSCSCCFCRVGEGEIGCRKLFEGEIVCETHLYLETGKGVS